MILEAWVSHRHTSSPDKQLFDRLVALVGKWTPVGVPEKVRFDDLVPYLLMDKKSKKGVIRFSLVKGIGEPVTGVEIPVDQLRKYLSDPEIRVRIPWLDV